MTSSKASSVLLGVAFLVNLSVDPRWISYDDWPGRRPTRRRRWPWLLLAGLAAIAAMFLIGFGVTQMDPPDLQLAEPVAIQDALPALLANQSTILYVIDDSGSMFHKLPALHDALRNLADKPSENSEVAMIRFGDNHYMLFDFADPSRACSHYCRAS